jgi:hypothetical protein
MFMISATGAVARVCLGADFALGETSCGDACFDKYNPENGREHHGYDPSGVQFAPVRREDLFCSSRTPADKYSTAA